jgi:hypothetical protein
MGRLHSIVLNIDPDHSAVFHLQAQLSPGLAFAATEIENSLHWHRHPQEVQSPNSVHQFLQTSNRGCPTN